MLTRNSPQIAALEPVCSRAVKDYYVQERDRIYIKMCKLLYLIDAMDRFAFEIVENLTCFPV